VVKAKTRAAPARVFYIFTRNFNLSGGWISTEVPGFSRIATRQTVTKAYTMPCLITIPEENAMAKLGIVPHTAHSGIVKFLRFIKTNMLKNVANSDSIICGSVRLGARSFCFVNI